MIPLDELKQRIEKAGKIRRWYQSVPYGDTRPPWHHFDDGKTNPRSFGEGRWNNYIAPTIEHIAEELDCANSTFCDVGCSAGLFLLRAWEQFHFARLVGIEAANGGYEQLLITRDYYDQMPLLAYKVALGPLTKTIADSEAPQIDINTFPMADLTLMACTHYHMTEPALIDYLSILAEKSMYLMILTDEKIGGVINTSSDFFKKQIINSMTDKWDLVQELKTPAEWLVNVRPPCKELTVLLFLSRMLKRLLVEECFKKQMVWHKNRGGRNLKWQPFTEKFYTRVFPSFIDDVLVGKITKENYKECLVYDWQKRGFYGSTAWEPTVAAERTLSYLDMVLSIKEHGQEQPIGLQEHLNMVDPWDGWHRVAVLNHLNIKYVYGKEVIPECSGQM